MKVMAVVIIVLMLAFVGGSYLRQLGRARYNKSEIVAFYGDGKKITTTDLAKARVQLYCLRTLQANIILANAHDLNGIILGELLFSDRSTSAQSAQRLTQLARTSEFRISSKQINDIYRHPLPAVIYWTLLKNEAKQAGIEIPMEQARNYLVELIPRFSDGANYNDIIKPIVERQGLTEDEAVESFSQLLAVLQYSRILCSNENTTSNEQMHTINDEEQSIDIEFTEFGAELFADQQAEPTENQIQEHFDKYKMFFAGQVSEENPYGFGYKLPDRVKLEYIALRLEDLEDIVGTPSQEMMEEYYQRNIGQYVKQVPSDPNDPNSPMIKRTRTYAEVADDIFTGIKRSQIAYKAVDIMQQAKEIIEATENYETTAKKLSKEQKIKVYSGQTGFLSAEDMLQDKYLSGLFIEGYGHNPPRFINFVRLVRILFAIDQLDASELGPFEVPKPSLMENIGPLKDMLGSTIMIVRILEAQKASMPESPDYSYSKKTISVEESPEQKTDNNKVYSVRENLIQDIKKLEAMKKAKSEAEKFIVNAEKNGWSEETEKLNKQFKKNKTKQTGFDTEENLSEPFKLEKLTDLKKPPVRTMERLMVYVQKNPVHQLPINGLQQERLLIDQLFSLVEPDANSIDNLPIVIEVKPRMCYYCLKDISVKRLEQDRYIKIKAGQTYQNGILFTQSFAAVHFNPDNILKRLNCRLAEQKTEKTDTDKISEDSG
jgi:hypothetical protein